MMTRAGLIAMLTLMMTVIGCNHTADPSEGGASSAASGSESTEPTPATSEASDEGTAPAAESAEGFTPQTNDEGLAEVVFAGGCFWCVEAVFEQIDGVKDAISGYAGGSADTADYKAVSSGRTKHAEVVKIVYDPKKVDYDKLLEIHFATHDPTTLNRQGNDVGPQYRSTIFYHSEAEKAAAQAYIEKLDASGKFADPIVTTLEPLEGFYVAEAYHQDFVKNNPFQGYVRGVAAPKVEKTKKLFKDELKDGAGE